MRRLISALVPNKRVEIFLENRSTGERHSRIGVSFIEEYLDTKRLDVLALAINKLFSQAIREDVNLNDYKVCLKRAEVGQRQVIEYSIT